MRLSELTNYDDIQLVGGGEVIYHDVPGKVTVPCVNFGDKSVAIQGQIGGRIGNSRAGSVFVPKESGVLFQFGKGRQSGVSNVEFSYATDIDITAIKCLDGQTFTVDGCGFDYCDVGVDIDTNGRRILASSVRDGWFNYCRIGVRIDCGSLARNSSAGIVLDRLNFTGGDIAIEVLQASHTMTIRDSVIQAQKKAGLVLCAGNHVLDNLYVETKNTGGTPSLLVPSLVVLGNAKVVMRGGLYHGVFFENPANVTGDWTDLRPGATARMDMNHMRLLGIVT